MKMMPEKALHYSSSLVDLIPGDLADHMAVHMNFTGNLVRDFRKGLDGEKAESRFGTAEMMADGYAYAETETVEKIDVALLALTGESGHEMRRELAMDFYRQKQGIEVDPDKYGGFTPRQVHYATEIGERLIYNFIDK